MSSVHVRNATKNRPFGRLAPPTSGRVVIGDQGAAPLGGAFSERRRAGGRRLEA